MDATKEPTAAMREILRRLEEMPVNLRALNRFAIERAMNMHNGNKTHAARELGISVRTLQRSLAKWSTKV